jgi:hypothetical protein
MKHLPADMSSDPPNNVFALPGQSLPGVDIASTASKGTRITGSRNEVWLCQAYDSAARGVLLFVKPSLSMRAMMVEVLAAQVGHCMGLPCPKPFLVTVNPRHIEKPSGPKLLAFGSEIKGRGMTFPILNADLLFEFLEKQKLTDALACFDEFIANGVRGPRDIVFDPEHGVSIIDHEGAMDPLTAPDAAITNWIATQVVARISGEQRPAFLKRLRARAAAAHTIEFGLPPAGLQFHQDGIPVYRELVRFLRDRLEHLDRLLSARVLPGQAHITDSTHKYDSGGTSNI